VEFRVTKLFHQADLIEQSLGTEISHGCIMLMQTGYDYSTRVSASSRGQDFAPSIIGFIADLAPIDCDPHNRCIRAEQDEPSCLERIGHSRGPSRQNSHKPVTEWYGHICSKPRQAKRSVVGKRLGMRKRCKRDE
jgi:hypothetical protein